MELYKLVILLAYKRATTVAAQGSVVWTSEAHLKTKHYQITIGYTIRPEPNFVGWQKYNRFRATASDISLSIPMIK